MVEDTYTHILKQCHEHYDEVNSGSYRCKEERKLLQVQKTFEKTWSLYTMLDVNIVQPISTILHLQKGTYPPCEPQM